MPITSGVLHATLEPVNSGELPDAGLEPLIAPKLELHSLEHEAMGDKHYVRLVLMNSGWLPTTVSEKGRQRKAVRPIEVELTLPPGQHTLQLVLGDALHIPHQPPVRSEKITITVQ